MKFILLTPGPAPKLETAHYRPKTLGEMQLAFLNANNKKSWAQDETYLELPPQPVRRPRVFKTPTQLKRALKKQQELLAKRAKQRFFNNLHTVVMPAHLRTNLEAQLRLQARDRADQEWNEMINAIPLVELTRLRDEMELPVHMLVCRLKRLTPQEEFDIWKTMTPREQMLYAVMPSMIMPRKHIYGTRMHFSYRSVLGDLAPLVEEHVPELDSHAYIRSRVAATALMMSKTSLSSDEYFARRLKLLYMKGQDL